jgi:hypothetical protein
VRASRKALYVAASAGIATLVGLAAASAFGGCTNNVTALAYTPITGIVIHSADLVAGHGCGTGPGQVYAYVAVLAQQNAPDTPVTSTVVSCYTDGVLSNLAYDAGSNPPPDAAAYVYYLYIYAYDYASFPPSLSCAPATPEGISNSGCPGDSPDATTAAATDGGDAGDAGIPPRYPPTWTTTCTAGEVAGEPMLADCKPLEPTAAAEASDAGADAASDAGADAASDAGADSE